MTMDIKKKSARRSMSPGSRRQALILLLAIGVLLNAAVLFLYVMPERDVWMQAKLEKERQLQLLKAAESEYTSKPIAEGQLEELLERIPVEHSDSSTLADFNELAKKSKVQLASVKQAASGNDAVPGSNAAAGSPAVTSSYEVMVVGELSGLLQYIDQLQQHKRLYTLQDWSIDELKRETIQRDFPDLFEQPFLQPNKSYFSLRMTVQTYSLPAFAEQLLGRKDHEA